MSTIFYLQYLQMEHDRNFHNDIYSLRPHDKVKHLTLHVVKYMGKLAVTRTQDEEALKRILTDSLIVCLSLANTFNLRLNDDYAQPEVVNMRPIARSLLTRYSLDKNLDEHSPLVGHAITSDMVELMGNASKAIEALDHLEDYPYVKELKKFVREYFKILLIASEHFGISFIEKNYVARLLDIESKNIFAGQLQAGMRSWQTPVIQKILKEGNLDSFLTMECLLQKSI